MIFFRKLVLLFKTGANKTRSSIKISFDEGIRRAIRSDPGSKKKSLLKALEASLIVHFEIMGRDLDRELMAAEMFPFSFMPAQLSRVCVAEYLVYHLHPKKADLNFLRKAIKAGFVKAQKKAPSEILLSIENSKHLTSWWDIIN